MVMLVLYDRRGLVQGTEGCCLKLEYVLGESQLFAIIITTGRFVHCYLTSILGIGLPSWGITRLLRRRLGGALLVRWLPH